MPGTRGQPARRSPSDISVLSGTAFQRDARTGAVGGTAPAGGRHRPTALGQMLMTADNNDVLAQRCIDCLRSLNLRR
jgi:hypothetical protein